MSPAPDPHTQLRPYAGSGARERPLLELTVGRWSGSARVTPIRLRPGRVRFSIDVTWTDGEPMHGFPPGPGQRHDMLLVDDLELAKALAVAAVDELRAGRASDLRALLQRFRSAA